MRFRDETRIGTKESHNVRRHNTSAIVIFAALFVFLFAPPSSAEPAGMASFFPDLIGWTRDGAPESFYPESLFEYINGAADVYLSYEFEELAALSYDGGEKSSLTIDIYKHRDIRNAFGIYSQEKSLSADFVEIGTEGYYDEGVLNFFQGPYYVKIMGFYLGDQDRAFLTDVANAIAAKLDGEPRFPEALECFPTEGRVPHSERYLARDVLGYGFLHSAYAADYDAGGDERRVFIFEAADEADALEMLAAYFELAGKKRAEVIMNNGDYKFVDPRRTSSGPLTIRHSGRYFWGLFSDDTGWAGAMIDAIAANLETSKLID
jgi:hypothetical protein